MLCFYTKYAKHLLFKGGTSLSKGWKIINRFSEDIDIAFSRDYFIIERQLACANCTSNTQIKKFREASQDFFWTEFEDELKEQISKMGLIDKVTVTNTNEEYALNGEKNEKGELKREDHDKDPSVIYVAYPSMFTPSPDKYSKPVVKIEVSSLSMDEPFEEREITSLINEVYSKDFSNIDSDYNQTIKVVSPVRTLLEKMFLLCEEYQKTEPRAYRMSRHLYDIEKLRSTPFYGEALSSPKLYKQIIEHRKKMYHIGRVDYDKDMPGSISIVPPPQLMQLFDSDYQEMQRSFIYDKESLPYSELISRIKDVENNLRNIKME